MSKALKTVVASTASRNGSDLPVDWRATVTIQREG
jgi:hypothetical protein